MSTRYEPRRLAADSDALAVAIAALRSEPPNAAQLDAVARRLAPQLATPVLAGSAPFALAWWAKWLLGVSVSLAIGAYVATRSARSEPQPRAHPTAVPIAAAARAEILPSPALDAVQTRAPDASPMTAARVRTPARRPAPHAIDAVPAAVPAPERELAVLERSRAALDTDPAAALDLAETHARDYPSGIFAQERELLAIEALLKLKRKPEARARAAHFVEHYPESPNARRVRALLDRTPDQRGVDPDARPATEQH